MTRRSLPVATSIPRRLLRAALRAVFPLAVLLMAVQSGGAQAVPYERTYGQSKSAVEKALKELQPSTSGRLPVLEGFTLPGDHPLNRYQRAYYQSAVQVSSTASGGSLVRVNTKVTAWYADSIPSRSGYQLLTSNGRLESDLLDQLTDLLATSASAADSGGSFPGSAPPASAKRPSVAGKGSANKGTTEPTISAPMPRSPNTGRTFSSSADAGLLAQQLVHSKNSTKPLDRTATDRATGLQAEAASLEEVLKNQAHPKNLVAIKKSGTPVVATPSLNGKTLFLASAHDEFEMRSSPGARMGM